MKRAKPNKTAKTTRKEEKKTCAKEICVEIKMTVNQCDMICRAIRFFFSSFFLFRFSFEFNFDLFTFDQLIETETE